MQIPGLPPLINETPTRITFQGFDYVNDCKFDLHFAEVRSKKFDFLDSSGILMLALFTPIVLVLVPEFQNLHDRAKNLHP